MNRVEGYAAVVTGGARGIGKAICALFAEEGAKSAVTDILDEEGRNLVREIMVGISSAEVLVNYPS
ncbi:MAG: SDR family NAD(P)-dependent oxidoreductase [Desulfatiglandaceae bacterium]